MSLVAPDHQFPVLPFQTISLLAVRPYHFHQYRKIQIKHRSVKNFVKSVDQFSGADPSLTIHGNMDHIRIVAENLTEPSSKLASTRFQHPSVLLRQLIQCTRLCNHITVVNHLFLHLLKKL